MHASLKVLHTYPLTVFKLSKEVAPASVGIWTGHVLGRDSLGQSQTLDKKV